MLQGQVKPRGRQKKRGPVMPERLKTVQHEADEVLKRLRHLTPETALSVLYYAGQVTRQRLRDKMIKLHG